ncbi:MAG: hypothetical protein ACYDBH_18045 [Acidobacteriaceae bacterium]
MPIHKAGSGEQWGNHGKVYHGPDAKEKAEKQAAAAHANGFRGDAGESLIASKDDTRTEMDVAHAIASGELDSPQRIGDQAWLFDMRVTGTGVSFRPAHDEYVFRPPEYYLCDAFLERCQGLPVILDHPEKGLLNTEEFRQRSIGSIILPYIPSAEDDKHSPTEVWGIARIYDRDAAEMMLTTHTSTSPAVQFDKDGTQSVRTEDGSSLLIEGNPKLLDHLAVCEAGVWDKGEPPSGIA